MEDQVIKIGEVGSERELTRVNRAFDMEPYPIEDDVETNDGKVYTYYTGTKQIFNISFANIPNNDADTLDGKTGRDNLKLEYDKHIPLNLIVYKADGSYSQYSVKFTSYKEDYLRPLAGDTTWRYNITIGLREV
jgi:hypothetical protein